MLSITELIEIAKEIEHTDPIDWGYLSINEDDAYRLIAASILEFYQSMSTDVNTRETMLLATVVKLSVENFVLNYKLLQKYQE